MTETPHQAPPDGPPPPPEPQSPPGTGWNTQNLKDYRRMRRSRSDRKVAGVAAGLGRHIDVDPTILRVLFVVLTFFGGSGLLLYGALWLFVPEEGTEDTVIGTSEPTRNALLIGALVLAGLLAVGDSWNGYGGFPWPLAIVALVVAAVLVSRDKSSGRTAPGPATTSVPDTPDAPEAPWYPTAPAAPSVQPRPRRSGPLLFGITLALIALALGILGLYDVSGNSVSDAAYPALALAVTGAMLVLGAFYGRAGGLILIGLVSSVALGGAAITDPSYHGDRSLVIQPVSSAVVQDSYDVPAGRIELDLTEVSDLEEVDGRNIHLSANVGEIVVIVPRDLEVTYGARIEYGGAIETPDGVREGWGPTLHGTLPGDDPVAGLALDVDLELGHIEVRQE